MAIGASSDAAKSQKRSQAFTRQMMKKAHQWEVDDLILAGLNPILSATGGSGPMGASPAPFGSDASSALDVAQAGGAVSRGVGEAVRSAAAPQLTASEKKIRAFQETTYGHEARRVGFVASKEQELEQVAHHEARLSKATLRWRKPGFPRLRR